MDKEYLFNPFNIKNVPIGSLSKVYDGLMEDLVIEPNTMYEYAKNIECYANMNYLVGEIIARRTKEVLELKTTIEIDKAINMTAYRKNWNTDKQGKAPAMAYFEALATKNSQDNINRLADLESSLKRFKNAYSSIEEKMNALKKKWKA